jgi:putative DNA methylase
MRSELSNRPVASGTNALASSIVLVCRPRPQDAPLATRKEFISALRAELPQALRHLQHGNIAPVDLAQAAIGPGMAVFTRYAKVLEADGTPMPVRQALTLINQVLDEVITEQEGEFDADTRWAIVWFEQFGMDTGSFGVAETLSKAKNTAVQGMVEAGILEAKASDVRLLRREELDADWDPASDKRLTVWEVAQHLISALGEGEGRAADLARRLGPALAEQARDLAYRLYLVCERKKWAQEALAYNSLVIAWPQIMQLAAATTIVEPQTQLEV